MSASRKPKFDHEGGDLELDIFDDARAPAPEPAPSSPPPADDAPDFGTPTITIAYASNRSPTGHATALLVVLESGVWGYVPDGQRTRVAVAPGEALFDTAEDAVIAASYRWRCKVFPWLDGYGRRPHGARPTPIAIVGLGRGREVGQ